MTGRRQAAVPQGCAARRAALSVRPPRDTAAMPLRAEAAGPRAAARNGAGRRRRLVALVAVTTAIVVAIGHGGETFWVCVPAAMLAGALQASQRAVVAGATVVLAAAAGPLLVLPGASPLPSPLLGLAVPAASVAVLVVLRGRFERERELLRQSAYTDALTGLANRRALLERIEYEVARHTRARRSFAVVMLDLDGFKQLNDRFGHPAGDELLCDVAAALRHAMRDQDTVARIGGDEFCVLAPETDAPGAQRLALRAKAAVARVATGLEAVSASAGAAVFPDHGGDASILLAAADERLLDAKRHVRAAVPGRRAA